MTIPAVLFLCIHNAGRSQMALGWFEHLAQGRAVAFSGGSEPAEAVNPAAVAAMAEVGIDIAGRIPRRWSDADFDAADVVVTMGCGDSCPFVPGKRYEDWALDDPAGQGIDAVRPIRDDIERRVRGLLASLGVQADGYIARTQRSPRKGIAMPDTYTSGTVLTCEHEGCGCRVVIQEQCNCSGADNANYTCACGAKLVPVSES